MAMMTMTQLTFLFLFQRRSLVVLLERVVQLSMRFARELKLIFAFPKAKSQSAQMMMMSWLRSVLHLAVVLLCL